MIDLSTRACRLLGCEHPILLAGMGGVSRAELVSAVCEAGGFGFLGMVREPSSFIGAQIAQVRANTDHPFGVNLIPAATDASLLQSQIATCIEARIHSVGLFWDLNAALVSDLRRAGILVTCQVGSVREAVDAERAGANLIIAQGVEAGGHVRGTTGLSTLVSDVIAAVKIPVIAAGGIVDGRGLVLALLQGAQGVAVGTAFLATSESSAHDYHKNRIIEARADETIYTDLFHINWPSGAFVRVLPNSVTRGERGAVGVGPRKIIGHEGGRPIYLFSTDSPLCSMMGDFEAMALYAGQGAARINKIVPAGERLRTMLAEAWQMAKFLPSGLTVRAEGAGGNCSTAEVVQLPGNGRADN